MYILYMYNTPHTPPPYESIKELGWRQGGLQTSFLQMKTCATAADSLNESNEDNTKACLGFLVYLFCGRGYLGQNRRIRQTYYLWPVNSAEFTV
jgi:hypothetical protein